MIYISQQHRLSDIRGLAMEATPGSVSNLVEKRRTSNVEKVGISLSRS
jgi:hypothetical protein